MSSEQNHGSTRTSAPHSILQLALSSGDRNANSGPCPRASSPDSQRSLSDRGTSSPSDIDMMEVCLNQDSPDDHPSPMDAITNSSFVLPAPQVTVPVDGKVEESQTSMSSCMDNTSVDNWNGNISLVISNLRTSPSNARENEEVRGERSMAPSPNSAEGENLSASMVVLLRDSSENGCSLSSEEMVMRNNSFCLQDDQALAISLLEDTSGSPALAPCSPSPPTELSLMSATLPDVCEGFLEVQKNTPAQQCWGMTFILPEDHKLPPEDDPVVQSASPGALPLDRNGGHLRTFLCEPDPASTAHDGVSLATVHCSKPASDAEPSPYFTGDSAPREGRPDLFPAKEDPDSSDHVTTSTPVQNVGNESINFPILNESPFTTSPTPLPGPRTAVTPKGRLVARLPPSTGRISKTEIKIFRKPDFSCIKPKIMTRAVCKPSMGSPVLAKATSRNQAQVTLPRKLAQGNKSKSPSVSVVNNFHPKSDGDSEFSKPLAETGESFGAPYFGMTFIQSEDQNLSPATEDGECRDSVRDIVPPVCEHVSVASPAGPEAGCVSSRSGQLSSGPCPGNQSFCFPSLAESNSSKDQDKSTSAPVNERKQEVLNHNRKRIIATSNQEKPPMPALRSRCLSESSSVSRGIREKRGSTSSSSSFTTSRTYNLRSQANRCLQNRPNRELEASKATPDRPSPEFRKVIQATEPSKTPVTAAAGGGAAGRGVRVRPSPFRPRGAPLAGPSPSPSPRPVPLAPRQRQGTWGRDGSSNPGVMGTLRTKNITTSSSSAGSQMARSTKGPSGRATPVGATSTKGGTKPPVSRSRTPGRGSTPAHPSTPASRLLHKPQAPGANRSQPSKTSERSFSTANTQASGGCGQSSAGKPSSSTASVLRARHLVQPGRCPGAASVAACKTTTLTNQTSSLLKRTASSRVVHPTASLPVDKSRTKANPRNQAPAQSTPTPASPAPTHGHPDLVLMAGRTRGPVESYQVQCEKQKRLLQHLQGLLASSDCRFQAVIVVLQQALAERDEVMKKRRELSQEMITLKGELVSSSHTCDRLKQEKEQALSTMEEVLLKVQEQHCRELAQLEERLQTFYQAEWDKVHLTYQQEADKCKALMEQQMGELRAAHDDLRLVLENRHTEQLQTVQKQYEDSLEEMRKTHEQELQTLERTLKDAEATLSGQIQELTAENSTLSQRLKAEEDRRRELADKNQKDSHTLYLEQELESLKVVLDIKIKQLHQQDKKLMQMDKLMEKSVKLDECLQKVQQENEDLRARMDRHTALSRQLSTEQAVLQESLQKESKVNKRLSMENEELLWKLHNGDLSSPRKMSPTSPAHALSLQSPRNSAIFSSPPVSPR